jgi:acyl-CoA synthetase (AMP-forming)/AMP-acid ligase II
MTSLPIRTLADLVRVRAQTLAEQRAYHFLGDGENESATLTYAELDRRAHALAVSIRARVDPCTAVILAFPAGLDFIVAFFACLYASVVAVPEVWCIRAAVTSGLQRLWATARRGSC